MSHFSAISLVTEALEVFLTGALHSSGLVGIDAKRHMLQPPPAPNQPLLTIFLYDIAEDSTVRNRGPVHTGGGFARAPIPIILRYMITPWSPDPGDAYRMLGCTIGALHDSRTLIGNNLRASLGARGAAIADIDVLALNMAQLTLEEKSKIWWAIQLPFHLSVMYELRVVDIDPSGLGVPAVGSVTQRELETFLPTGVTI